MTLDEYTTASWTTISHFGLYMGDANDRRTVFINGRHLTSRPPCSALRHIRKPKRELKVWADGSRINQSDVEEKKLQVQQMGAIYQLARTRSFILESRPHFLYWLFDLLASYSTSPDNNGPAYISSISRLSSVKAGGIRNDLWRFQIHPLTNVESYRSKMALVRTGLGPSRAGVIPGSMGSDWPSTS